jgi:DNA modification methylase
MSEANIRHGDCLEVLQSMPDGSVDAIVTDPPYGLSFMGKRWDYDVPSVEIWRECLRVLKPGGHLLAFAGTRTQHRMAVRIEDAGFEIRDMIAWVYGSGFPKSLDVSKAIDKAAGAEREVVGRAKGAGAKDPDSFGNGHNPEYDITAPATDAARQWHGWGTALKPALEPITVARKPFPGTVAANVLEHGTGALNVDGCRVEGPLSYASGGFPERTNRPAREAREEPGNRAWARSGRGVEHREVAGRWPANLIHDGSDEVVGLFPYSVSTGGSGPASKNWTGDGHTVGAWCKGATGGLGDSGSAARFFYCAKASKADRDEGLDMGVISQRQGARPGSPDESGKFPDHDHRERIGNNHPTVKPTDLMRYLCRLVTPPGGVVLDPFCGSGSTGKAAVLEGFRFIGIERDPQYIEIARARVAAVRREPEQVALI